MLVEAYIRTENIAVTAQYLFLFRIPDYQLLIRIIHNIVLINIHGHSCSATGSTKCNLTQTSDFLHRIG